jgi:iron(III) transport system substrate-binding protein
MTDHPFTHEALVKAGIAVIRLHRRRLVAIALAGMTAATLAGCTGSGGEGTIQVYSARQYDLEQAFVQFNEETGIEVEFLFGDDAELRERISAEGEDTVADAYITVDAGNLAEAAAQGILQPVESTTLDEAVPSTLRDTEGRWYGLAKRVRTIAYSPERVDPATLSTYENLAEPEWQGRLCLRTATASYTQSLVASMIAADGEEEARETVRGWAQNARIFGNDVEIIENIASGNCDVGIINHYYLARELRDDPDLPVELFWADQQTTGVHVNISGAGVTANADNADGAQRLLEWLATDGQEALVDDNLEYPVNAEVAPDPILVDFGDFTEQTIDATAYADLNSDAVELLALAGYR